MTDAEKESVIHAERERIIQRLLAWRIQYSSESEFDRLCRCCVDSAVNIVNEEVPLVEKVLGRVSDEGASA